MKSNVRVIAATHQDLEQRVKAGAFREDLFHRLNVIRLRLPALRERTEDIAPLARFFLQKSARELGVEGKRLTDAAIASLVRFDYPGNVRQLENICHWLTVMAPAQLVDAKDLPPELQPQGATRSDSRPARRGGRWRRADGRSRRPGRRRGLGGGIGPARLSPLAGAGATASTAIPGWLGGLEQPRPRAAAVGRAHGVGHADARVRGPADPLRARRHARPAHRGGAQAGHRQKHDHAQDPGAGSGRGSDPRVARQAARGRVGDRTSAAPRRRHPHLDKRLDGAPALRENHRLAIAPQAPVHHASETTHEHSASLPWAPPWRWSSRCPRGRGNRPMASARCIAAPATTTTTRSRRPRPKSSTARRSRTPRSRSSSRPAPARRPRRPFHPRDRSLPWPIRCRRPTPPPCATAPATPGAASKVGSRPRRRKLSALEQEFNGGEPERHIDEFDFQKYHDRVAHMRSAISRKQIEIAELRREIDKLPTP